MTTPDERTRALLWAGGLLIEFARDESLPLDIRQQAVAIARHFPTYEDISNMARHASALGMDLKNPTLVDMADGCPLGPLRQSTRLAWPEGPQAEEVRAR